MPEQSTEQELISQLGSDKRSLRIQAIVKLTRVGKSQAALEALNILVSSGDREEAFFATQAITKISQKIGRIPTNNNIDINKQTNSFSTKEEKTAKSQKFTSNDFLSVSKDRVLELLQFIRTRSSEIPEDVLPSVGVFLTKYGDKTDADFILNYLKSHSGILILPYISAADKIDSKIIIPVLPYLLASKEALIRSRAVMILRKIDSAEAERHFLRLLASKQAEDRLAALEISFLFPFDHVKNYIIALLSEEKDSDVFKACAAVLASNPSQELALRILDVLEAAPQYQKKAITTIFNFVCVAIKSAKVLSPEEATPQALVASWKKHRLNKFLNDLEIQLCTTTGEKREGIINWFEKNKNIPDVADFIEHLSLNPQTEDVYQRLSNLNNNLVLPAIDSIFEQADKAKSETPIKNDSRLTENESVIQQNQALQQRFESEEQKEQLKQQNDTLPELSEVNGNVVENDNIDSNRIGEEISDSEQEQIQYLKQLDMQEFLTVKHQITDLAEDTNASVNVRVEALNALLRLSPSSRIKSLGVKALEEDDIRLKTVGFKILERVSPDVLKMKLSDLLLSDDTNIRVRAIRFGLKIDQEKAINALKNLVHSKEQNHRSYAISCLALCPFEAVYEILIEALQNEKYPLVAKQITSILLSNPDPVVLDTLDKLSVLTIDPNLDLIISQARNELEEILTSMKGKNKTSNLKEIDVFDKSEKKEDKPYSVENVRKITQKEKMQKNTDNNKPSNLLDNLLGTIIIFTVAALVLGLIVFVFWGGYTIISKASSKDYSNIKTSTNNKSPSNKVFGNKNNTNSSKKGGNTIAKFAKNKTYNLIGKVTNTISVSSIVVSCDGREVMVKFNGKEAQGFKKGDTVEVTFSPYRENPNGIILANGKKISKAE